MSQRKLSRFSTHGMDFDKANEFERAQWKIQGFKRDIKTTGSAQ